MPDTPPVSPPPPGPPRTVERILVETFLVALAGAFALALAWELGRLDDGWVIAIVIWIVGGPILELVRLWGGRR